jgi:CRISPR-associated protein
VVAGSLSAVGGGDLVVLAFPGVQRFIREARSTADVRAGSEIVAGLAASAARRCAEAGAELVFPSADPGRPVAQGGLEPDDDVGHGMPNRVVFLAPAGTGADLAGTVASAVQDEWRTWAGQALNPAADAGMREAFPQTPGFPLVQWASVPAGPGGYREQWEQVRRLMEARRQVHDFPHVLWERRKLCSLSPQWPAEKVPAGLSRHQEATLSAPNWVKRRWHQMRGLDGFPSTSSVASARYRDAVLARFGDREVGAAVAELMDAAWAVMESRETAVPGLRAVDGSLGRWFRSSGGPWVFPEQWQAGPLAREAGVEPDAISAEAARGFDASRALAGVMEEKFGIPAPANYLAVIVQDLDGMGRFLSGEGFCADGAKLAVSAAEHARVSRELRDLAGSHWRIIRSSEFLGVPVYAGGDDLLVFIPAATALSAAQACHDAVPRSLPTASTAVLFFHYHAGMQSAMAQARRMVEEAKGAIAGKHALSVGYLRRSGASELSVQPWSGQNGRSAVGLFGIFADDLTHPLSPRLVADLQRDHAELGRLARRDEDLYFAELRRLVRRHIRSRPGDGGSGSDPGVDAADAAARAADALAVLGAAESARSGLRARETGDRGDAGRRPELAARIGVFLRQEAR